MVLTLIESLRLNAYKIPIGIDRGLRPYLAAILHLPASDITDYRILAKSTDSRKTTPYVVYRVAVNLPDKYAGKYPAPSQEFMAKQQPATLDLPDSAVKNPLVIGSGPAGIFAAMALAMAGSEPILLERGAKVAEREEWQKEFLKNRRLDEDNNLLIGEGGAGTFSDGKLYTGTKDACNRFVREELVRSGANADILYYNRPHLGSDKLPKITENLRKRLIELGGKIVFGANVTEVVTQDGRFRGIKLANGEFVEGQAAIVAPGLGGRNLVKNIAKVAEYELKPFQIGCRIENPQQLIDKCQYHGNRPEALGTAEYHLLSRPGNGVGSVSTFCMCPGGEIVNASAWSGQNLTNGMSRFARNGEFANSCLITTLPRDYFRSPGEVERFLTAVETKVFECGGKDYTFPAQDAAAFLRGKLGLTLRKTAVQTGIRPGRVDALLPTEVRDALRAALKHFDKICPGFVANGKLVGVESCVSSPLRFTRTETGSSSVKGLYLAGEGVGAAGGIVSAACDGLRCAINLLTAFAKKR